MQNFRQVNNQRIRQLAETLKRNGLATSESEAVRMAESMTQTENRVSERFQKQKDEAVIKTRFSRTDKDKSTPTCDDLQTTPASNAPEMPQTQNNLQTEPKHAEPAREEEVQVQESANAENPAPNHTNGAINQAIKNVKDQFKTENTQMNNLEIDLNTPTNQAASPDETPVMEVNDQEPLTQEVKVEEPVKLEPEMSESVVQDSTVKEPVVQDSAVERSVVQEPESDFIQQREPEQTEQRELGQTELTNLSKEQESIESENQLTEPTNEAHDVEQIQNVSEEKEEIVEKTQEFHQQPPKQDVSKFEESKVSLSDVFNFSKR